MSSKVEVFLLGAGRPAQGSKPAALRKIALKTRALDWQLLSFDSVVDVEDISFLGGYHVQEVIDEYSFLKYQVIPEWEKRSVLHTFLQAPFTDRPVITAYTDTVFRKESIEELTQIDGDVVFAVDSAWKERYESRSEADIEKAETVLNDGQRVEFTGLVYFSPAVVKLLSGLSDADIGTSLVDLINYLDNRGYSIATHDVSGHWAEFNSPQDVSRFILGTKSETLSRLEPIVEKSHIGSQVCFTSAEWRANPDEIFTAIQNEFKGENLIVRSSSAAEDNWFSSNAGGFESILNVEGADRQAISAAVDAVISSFGESQTGADQVLVQEFLSEVRTAGVVFTCDLETGAPYYRFNFDDKTTSTESVTSGGQNDLRTVILSRFSTDTLASIAPELQPVLEAIQELEELLGFDKLDIEFAISDSGRVHIFQVRPITVNHDDFDIDDEIVVRQLANATRLFDRQQQPSPFVKGDRTILANMPDWNPAEIIGTRPRPLAFSLYRYLITNEVWATQRAEFGYRDVNPHPLIVALCGQPYVDCRASLNSFIPATLPDDSAERLATAYLNILSDHPQYHDKIEFDVAFTVWTPDFVSKAEGRLLPYGVLASDISKLEDALKTVTRKAIVRLDVDIQTLTEMNRRRELIQKSNLPPGEKTLALLNDCKRFGTLAFSHAARAGFVATTLLRSFVDIGTITEERRLGFLKSFDTVSGTFTRDKTRYALGELELQTLIDRYGHLRPGTYEVCKQAYWEDPDRYLSSAENSPETDCEASEFSFSDHELKGIAEVLTDLGANVSSAEFINYLMESIKAREFVKFEFTRNLSLAIDQCVELGKDLGLSRDDVSFFDHDDLMHLKLNTASPVEIKKQIGVRKQVHAITSAIELPSVVSKVDDLYCFERFCSKPNFVGLSRVEGVTSCLNGQKHTESLSDRIVLIPQADPGYDWLFGEGIAGLITQYGGANSHMAIRAAEIGLPAAIGVGDSLYEQIASYHRIELDCGNQVIRKIE
ncbi:MAG: PEP/pyruvate-binding domain-containing protein [Pseudomonadota bacterium]